MRIEKRFRILLAAAPVSSEPIAAALGSHFELTRASSLGQAKQKLQSPHDMIICGLYFDDSRMFDLLRQTKAEEETRMIPFLAVKATEGELSPTLQQGIEIACAALGAEKFVDLAQWEQSYGLPAAQERLRTLISLTLALK